MKNILFVAAFLFSVVATAQMNVHFKVDHFLGSNPFAFNTATSNNLGNSFNVTRLQYYISQIVLVHDGGQQTSVSKWILADAAAPVNVSLGSYNITTLEAVKFAVGVEAAVNHLDPASYPMSHPLAPKSPSMHWGWASGYRFVAMEGACGASMNLNYEVHALGDANYFTVTLPTAGSVSGSDLNIEIDADYEKALNGINVSSGLILHSEAGAAIDFLRNFAYYVFTSAEGNATIGVEENLLYAENVAVYPNPSTQNVTLQMGVEAIEGLEFTVTDLCGKLINKGQITSQNQKFSFENNGMYFLSVTKSGQVLKTEKIIISN